VARIRDYKAEERRRNERAAAYGFTSRAQLRRARERGYVATARELKEIPKLETSLVEYAKSVNAPRDTGIISKPVSIPMELVRKRNAEWALSHSRQSITEWSTRWQEAHQRAYYEAFVRPFRIPNDERDFGPTYRYMMKYGRMPKAAYIDNPYRSV
jgi:hypothetical protein